MSPISYLQNRFFAIVIGLTVCTATHGCQSNPLPSQPTSTTDEADAAVSESFPLSMAIYTPSDSVEVVAILHQKTQGGSDVLSVARHFLGRPYVAHTLEVCDPERLVVNLQELDCTTFAETVLALVLTKRQQSDKFSDFCQNLQRLRYRGGVMNGYLSRLHYFTWWMHDNIDLGLLTDCSQGMTHANAPITVSNSYMSRHATAYKLLAAHPEWTDSIAHMEQSQNGADGFYIPERFTSLPASKLTEVQDGDLLAIVTTKAGLDYSHLGFAAWGKDGKLHLLNASSVYHKVVEDTVTLYDYLAKRKTSVGIRPLRLR